MQARKVFSTETEDVEMINEDGLRNAEILGNSDSLPLSWAWSLQHATVIGIASLDLKFQFPIILSMHITVFFYIL